MGATGPESVRSTSDPDGARARYHQAREAFERIADLPPLDQAAAIAELPDPEVAEEVGRLLAADGGGADLDVARRSLVPERLGPFAIVGVLGRGGMGTVYEAVEDAPRRSVALKVLHPWLRTPPMLAQARREAQALADVQHPGIPQILALHEVDGAPVVVMELVRGTPLLDATGLMGCRERILLLARVADTVACAHARGIVHRDLKPEHVLVTDEGQPKVLDFGVAWHPDGAPPAGSGTFGWMAPEQRRGEPVTPATDVWALGQLGREVLRGARPAHPFGARRELAAVLAKATAEAPGDRYADATAFAAELRRVLTDRAVQALPGAVPALRAGLRRHRRLLGAGGLLLVGLGLGALTATRVPTWAHEARAAQSLTALLADPRGPHHPEVVGALHVLLHDRELFGTSTLARAWSHRAATAPPDEALAAAIAAWSVATPETEASARDRLVGALLDADALAAATVPGPPSDRAVRARLAAARWDLHAADLAPSLAGPLAALSVALEVEPVETGALLPGGRRLTVANGVYTLDGQRESIEQEASGAVHADGRVLVWGASGWAFTGTADAPRQLTLSLGPLSSGVFVGDEWIVARPGDGGGAFRVTLRGEVLPLHAGTAAQALPVRDVAVVDLDGDGEAEQVLAATGWRGHELRVLSGGPVESVVKDRLRMAAWDLDVLTGPDSPRLVVLGGDPPAGPAPRGPRDAVWIVRWAGQGLTVEERLPLGRDAVSLYLADLDGDGGDEIVLGTQDGIGVLALNGEVAWLPGPQIVDVGPGDDDVADEVWVSWGGRGLILGAGVAALPARSLVPAVLPVPPAALHRPAEAQTWSRLAALASNGLEEAAAPLLGVIVKGRDEALAAAVLDVVDRSERPPGPAVLGLARQLQAHLPGGASGDALDALFARAHVQAGPTTALDLRQPLSPAWHVLDPASVRRDALVGRLVLDATPSAPLLALPLVRTAEVACVELDLHLESVDWSAGLGLRLELGGAQVSVVLWRVGGGDRSTHRLVLSRPHTAAAFSDQLAGPILASLCVGEGRASVALGDGPRAFTPLPEDPGPGPARLVLAGAPGVGNLDARALIHVAGLRLRGLEPTASAPGSDLNRRAAEQDPIALAELVVGGTPLQRAVAAEALGHPLGPLVPGLDPATRRTLLRRSPRAWLGPLLAVEGNGLSRTWLEAWHTALRYQDPWADVALLEPALAELETVDAPGRTLARERARALLAAGRDVAAGTLLDQVAPDDAEAELLRIRWLIRRGSSGAAAQALAAWLAEAPSREAADDLVAADSELAALTR